MQLSICGVNLRCKAPGQVTTATPSVTSPFSHLSQPMSPRFCLLVFLPNALLSLTDAPKPPAEDAYLRFDEYGGTGRPRRSAGKSQNGLNVETLVVADAKMVEKHGKDDVTTYILTVMNMVSSLFKDGTIGSDINIVVVSLILLEEEPEGLLINHHADQSLNSFCQWQSALVGKNGKRHDHAILLTGFDICSWKNEPCDTLGFAPISGMCSKYRSCTINEDTGLGLAFTIAHESGHK